MERKNIKINGHKGTWYVINEQYVSGERMYLLEHETYGDMAPCIIVDKDLNIKAEDITDGFDDVEKEGLLFSEWRKEEGYKSWEAIYNDELCEGKSTEEIKDEWEEITDEFEKYCEDYGFDPIYDED